MKYVGPFYVEFYEDEEVCNNCEHYCRNYVQIYEYKAKFGPCDCGHCTYPRFKNRKPDDTCKNFKRKELRI